MEQYRITNISGRNVNRGGFGEEPMVKGRTLQMGKFVDVDAKYMSIHYVPIEVARRRGVLQVAHLRSGTPFVLGLDTRLGIHSNALLPAPLAVTLPVVDDVLVADKVLPTELVGEETVQVAVPHDQLVALVQVEPDTKVLEIPLREPAVLQEPEAPQEPEQARKKGGRPKGSKNAAKVDEEPTNG